MITKYEQFVNEKININENYLLLESLNVNDDDKIYFLEIFNSIYEYHLTDFEKSLLEQFDYVLNESWFDDLKDKATRGVLKAKSEAGELLKSVAAKAKDVLDFVKTIATQIKDAVTEMFKNTVDFVKSKIIPTDDFIELVADYVNKKNDKNLKKYFQSCAELLKFVFVELPVKLFNKLVNFFKNIFSQGTNEGFSFFCNDFLNEADESEKKSFLQKLSIKIQSIPPFSWMPDMENIINQGITTLRNFIEKFFVWLDSKEETVTEAIDLTRKIGDTKFSRFSKSLTFIFDIFEIYVIFKINEKTGKIVEFQKAMKEGDISKFKKEIQDTKLENIYKSLNVDSSIKGITKITEKIPYVKHIIVILKNLGIGIGIYNIIGDKIKKISGVSTTGETTTTNETPTLEKPKVEETPTEKTQVQPTKTEPQKVIAQPTQKE